MLWGDRVPLGRPHGDESRPGGADGDQWGKDAGIAKKYMLGKSNSFTNNEQILVIKSEVIWVIFNMILFDREFY